MELFNQNKSLVPWVFTRFFYQYESYKDDLLQEGYLALFRSENHYNPSSGILFTTYATIAIKRSMLSYVQKFILKSNRTVSLSHMIDEDGEGNSLLLEDVLGTYESIDQNLFIEECLCKMPQRDKDILVAFSSGLSQNEVAEKIGISQATVSRCLTRFKNIYTEENK